MEMPESKDRAQTLGQRLASSAIHLILVHKPSGRCAVRGACQVPSASSWGRSVATQRSWNFGFGCSSSLGEKVLSPFQLDGVQNVWGEENVPENAPSRKILDPSKRASGLLSRGFSHRKNRATTPEGVENVPNKGGPKPLFGRGVIREDFLPPLFSTPPMASSEELFSSAHVGPPPIPEPNVPIRRSQHFQVSY